MVSSHSDFEPDLKWLDFRATDEVLPGLDFELNLLELHLGKYPGRGYVRGLIRHAEMLQNGAYGFDF